MKKMLTLLIAIGGFVAVNAQSRREEARKVILGQEKNRGNSQRDRDIVLGRGSNGDNYPTYPNSYPNSRRSRIDQINREYDAKIWSIRNNNTLSSYEKARIIRRLERERAQKIRRANQSNGNYYGKGNNGKHKGWSKGKGHHKRNEEREWDDD